MTHPLSTHSFNQMQYFKYLSIVIILLCAFEGCKPSFKETQSGLQYRVVQKGKSANARETVQKGKSVNPQSLEYLLVAMRYESEKGDLLFDTADQNPPVALVPYKEEQRQDGGTQEVMQLLYKEGLGAKLTFKIAPEKLFGENTEKMMEHYRIDKDTRVVLHTELKRVMNQEQYEGWEKEQLQVQKENTAKQTQKDMQTIEKYLQDHNLTAQKTASGLYYIIEETGQGSTPQPGNRVQVNYTGYLLDGRVFDTSVEAIAKEHGLYNAMRPYEPIAFQLGIGQVIQGWDEGIGLLNKGSKAKLLIPSTLGYGSQGAGAMIPPNASLIFDVELVDYQAE